MQGPFLRLKDILKYMSDIASDKIHITGHILREFYKAFASFIFPFKYRGKNLVKLRQKCTFKTGIAGRGSGLLPVISVHVCRDGLVNGHILIGKIIVALGIIIEELKLSGVYGKFDEYFGVADGQMDSL